MHFVDSQLPKVKAFSFNKTLQTLCYPCRGILVSFRIFGATVLKQTLNGLIEHLEEVGLKVNSKNYIDY